MKQLYVVFKRIENKEIFEDIKKMYLFLDEISINFDLRDTNKKVISDPENNFYQIMLESKEISIYITYWKSIDLLTIEILAEKVDPFKIYEYFKNKLSPKYWSISMRQNQMQDLNV